jgi:hypothetical protein
MQEAKPPLRPEEVQRVLGDLEPLIRDAQVILVGGQALAFWSGRLRAAGEIDIVTSKDIDFEGTADAARLAGRLLGAEVMIPSAREPSPLTGVVTFVDTDGIERSLDFIGAPRGLTDEDVRETAIQVTLAGAGTDEPVAFWVMHPERCMESRIYNTIELDRTDATGLSQLRASIPIARRWSEALLGDDAIEQRARQRAVLALNERIFEKCCEDYCFLAVHARHGVDPFDAVINDARLPKGFAEKRYPKMVDRLAKKRS